MSYIDIANTWNFYISCTSVFSSERRDFWLSANTIFKEWPQKFVYLSQACEDKSESTFYHITLISFHSLHYIFFWRVWLLNGFSTFLHLFLVNFKRYCFAEEPLSAMEGSDTRSIFLQPLQYDITFLLVCTLSSLQDIAIRFVVSDVLSIIPFFTGRVDQKMLFHVRGRLHAAAYEKQIT